jgi:hypothetical protein
MRIIQSGRLLKLILPNLGFQGLDLKLQGKLMLNSRVGQGLDFKFQGLDIKIRGLDFKLQGIDLQVQAWPGPL